MRIFHGPLTVAGIGWHLAEGQRDRGCKSDCVVYDDKSFRQLHHSNLKLSDYSKLLRVFFMLKILFSVLCRYDVIHFYSGGSFLPLNLDLPVLRLFRKKLIMTYCGSDIRLIELVEQYNDYAHLLRFGVNDKKYDRWKKWRMKWQSIWIQRFTAIRNLHEHAVSVIPNNKVLNEPWLNNIGFNSHNISELDFVSTNKVPKIIHAPSDRGVKGSLYVSSAVGELRARGIKFEFQELHGVPNDEVQKIIKKCDIVIDQLLLGGIGTLAFEGMGYGKPVVAYIPDNIKEKYMPDCPVFNANIDNLTDRLEMLIANPELRIELGKQGILFVKKHLNYDRIQDEVLKIYENL